MTGTASSSSKAVQRYAAPTATLNGVDELRMISANELGNRAAQHRAVIDAIKAAAVTFLAYTSVLHADTSTLGLAAEHRDTEAASKASGAPHVWLRNGWYSKNYLANVPSAVEHGVLLGSAGEGRISSAPCADYAQSAAVVLTTAGGQGYELAGDSSDTLTELAALISKKTGKPVVYKNLPQAEFEAVLISVGLPAGLAALLADSDAAAAKGALFDESGVLGRLIGRGTASVAESLS
ncbi:KR domain-containing protein [Pseudomonas sp. SMV71]|uniref:KR domain-containing protein n=1 Tax=Pseudomonas sp. SMV71 TaxID=3390195 RepID=UPI003F84A50C